MPHDYKDAIGRINNYAPYLAECLTAFPDIHDHFRKGGTPQDILDTYHQKYLGPINGYDEEMSRLRVLKRAVHLICAIADLSSTWSWVEVTATLSDLADIAVKRILRAAAIKANINGRDDNPVPGLFIIAMGKHGARELNYSSDIDFTVFYDPDVISLPDMARAERSLIRLVRDLIKGLELRTIDGYIFRTDLRLRPDPRSNSVAVSTRAAERYYEALGQNWERAALIKARICAGDQHVGEAFKKQVLSPFIWRRSLDFAAIEDIQAIKRQIDARSGGELVSAAGYHVKLGRGGIREIEFYAQVQQLILGGRYPELRQMRTLDALKALSDAGFVAPKITEKLSQSYAELRQLEHSVQMQYDAQDHVLPEDDKARESLAKLRGVQSLEDFDVAALAVVKNVARIYRNLYPEADSLATDEGSLVFTGVEPDPQTLKTLQQMGFAREADVWMAMSEWLGGRIMATRTVRARELLTRLAPQILKSCQMTGRSDHAFFAFARFFTNLRAGVQALSLFVQKPNWLEQLIGFMALSERISDQLAQDPSIMDAMVEPDYLSLNTSHIKSSFGDLGLELLDFETAINAVRVLVKELRFRLTLSALSGKMIAPDIMNFCSVLASDVISALLPVAMRETERIFGAIKGEFAVIGLGKLGGEEMRLNSDLDMMLIYNPSPEGEARPDIYSKLTQRLMSALSVITSEGGLYDVDLTLRPSGRAGPVAVNLEAFKRYYNEKAWAWEFMALTRARIITASSASFSQQLSVALCEAMTAHRPDLDFKADIMEMLRRTHEAKPASFDWDIKNAIGGLRDIEYIVQSLWLENRETNAANWPRSTYDMLVAASNKGDEKGLSRLLGIVDCYHNIQQWQSLFGSDDGRNIDQILNMTNGSLQASLPQGLNLDLIRSYQKEVLKIRQLIIGC